MDCQRQFGFQRTTVEVDGIEISEGFVGRNALAAEAKRRRLFRLGKQRSEVSEGFVGRSACAPCCVAR